jgi:hypothetical protein
MNYKTICKIREKKEDAFGHRGVEERLVCRK